MIKTLELRRNTAARRELESFIQERLGAHTRAVAAPLIPEREADTLRGRIAELHHLLAELQANEVEQ